MGIANLVKVDEIIRLSVTPRHMFFGIQGLLRYLNVIAIRRRTCNSLEWDDRTLMMELLDKNESCIVSKNDENIAKFYERKKGESTESFIRPAV